MERAEIREQFFPEGIPRLWCPLITHYNEDGSFAAERSKAHIAHLSPYVHSFLAPGSTGDGWEMSPEERLELIEMLRDPIAEIDGHLLLGVLETEQGAAADEVAKLNERYRLNQPGTICGVTVTAPKGASLAQDIIAAELAEVLELGVPTALYQLPQITENEILPETSAELSLEFPNFYMFKDTSGEDKVAMSGGVPENLFLVRGAEGDYYRWYQASGGPYDGFLLSTANGFAPQLARIIELSDAGQEALGRQAESDALTEARGLSDTLSKAVEEIFAAVSDLSFGNPFANGNKSVDHWMAFGPKAGSQDSPMTHSGQRIPASILEQVGGILEDAGFLPKKGYLE